MMQTMYKEKEEKDLPVLRITWMHQYKESRTIVKIAKKDKLLQKKTASAT